MPAVGTEHKDKSNISKVGLSPYARPVPFVGASCRTGSDG